MTPFDTFYAELVNQLKTDAQIVEWVDGVKKVVSYDETEHDPRPANVQTADLPEIVAYLKRFGGNLHRNSSGSQFDTTWSFMVSTGDYNSRVIHAGLFLVIKTMARWETWAKPLTWRSEEFVTDVNLGVNDLGDSNPDANRGIRGWACVAEYDVRFTLSTAAIKQGLE